MKFKLFETIEDPGVLPEASSGSLPLNMFSCGYATGSFWASFHLRALNIVLALLMILLALPVSLVIGLIIKFYDGGPIFYRGTRLGLCKTPFFMYKFRTLPVGTQRKLGDVLFSNKAMRLNPFASFLRDTRLDELPQLFNVLIGDMNFVGPRPIRPQLYETVYKTTPNYDLRFTVPPGLIGYAQLLTPHSAPKRLRALINNRYLNINRSFGGDIFIVLYTITALSKTALFKGSKLLYKHIVLDYILGRFSEKRNFNRLSPTGLILATCHCNGVYLDNTVVVDINEEYCKINTNHELQGKVELTFRKEIRRTCQSKNKIKKAYCVGEVFKTVQSDDKQWKYSYVLKYEATTQLNRYFIEKYILRKSIV